MHLYIHVPFCARRCSYCDFAIAVRRTVPSTRFAEAVLREWAAWQRHPAWADAPEVRTIYFGGGTPSRLDPGAIGRIIEQVRLDRAVADGAEVTLEANPDDVTPARAAAWQRAGVNRISLGVQSFDPAVLAWMHRTHRAEQVPEAVQAIRGAGIDEISLDLIFALPSAFRPRFADDLAAALALAPEHVSLYGLTVEPGTPLGRWTERGDVVPAAEERYAEEFLAAHQALESAGYEHYEVSNAARPGYRARHNSAYWRRAPYIGMGPSAHSGFGRERRWNLRDWAAYERAATAGADLVAGREELDDAAIRLEELYLGLRTADGIPAHLVPADDAATWQSHGWASVAGGRLRLTPEGWLRLDALVAGTVPSPRSA
ncbi:MAG TPA: radical SAM family heme chaperone HemW [Gemmatimonadales bacterium]|nr:radical SAM family heme chaperone HemW [Gemmatimonadales bacterium]